MRRTAGVGIACGLVLALTACSSAAPATEPRDADAAPTSSAPTSSAPTSSAPASSTSPATPARGTVPPPWLGTRVLTVSSTGYGEPRTTPRVLRQRRFTLPDQLPALPGTGFTARVRDPAPAVVIDRSTWRPGCPVSSSELAWVRLTFRGFDGGRHTGELLVASSVARDVVGAFRELWRADFPIEQMHITSAADLDLPPTGDGNGTGAFVCRPVTGSGGGPSDDTAFSQHAYGLAIDVNPFQNPYERTTSAGRIVLPELASSYLDRGDVRPGMLLRDGPVVRAFARIGWEWGGDYRSLKDYQHLSLTGG